MEDCPNKMRLVELADDWMNMTKKWIRTFQFCISKLEQSQKRYTVIGSKYLTSYFDGLAVMGRRSLKGR